MATKALRLTALRKYVRELVAQVDLSRTLPVFVGTIALTLLGGWIVYEVPRWQVGGSSGKTDANQFDREDAARRTLAQIMGGIVILGGLYMSSKTFSLSREGHITDRFTKAIEQLGKTDGANPNIEVRLGGIYALERIALDSERDHWAIVEVLTTYVRQNSPVTPKRLYTEGETPRIDIQAILTVLGRRRTSAKREGFGPGRYIELRGHLSGAKLTHANLKGADLTEAVLQRARLWGANLEGAALMKADLQQADLREAHLKGAFFREANLNQANLEGTDLREAQDLTINQITSAANWRLARFSPATRSALGLPPE